MIDSISVWHGHRGIIGIGVAGVGTIVDSASRVEVVLPPPVPPLLVVPPGIPPVPGEPVVPPLGPGMPLPGFVVPPLGPVVVPPMPG